MAATYIQPTIGDFEKVFGKAGKAGKKAFALHAPNESEAYYLCTLKEYPTKGRVCIKVFTSIAPGRESARDVGRDAIRVCLIWLDNDGWQKGLGRKKRVNRAAGSGKTARDIVKRALDRARDVAKSRGHLPTCGCCGRPMVLRLANKSDKVFYGCIAWRPYNEGCNGTKWDVSDEEREQILKKSKRI